MPPDRLPDGSTYQTAWEALTGLFDKRRHGKPIPVEQQDPDEHDPDKQDAKAKDNPTW